MDCLLDTSAVFALLVPRDDRHEQARKFAHTRNLRMVTTLAIVGEAFTTVRRRQGFEMARRWVRGAQQSPIVAIHAISESDDAQIWATLERLRGIELSYADASLIVLGERLHIRRVFAFDDDFRRAGLEMVPA